MLPLALICSAQPFRAVLDRGRPLEDGQAKRVNRNILAPLARCWLEGTDHEQAILGGKGLA